LVFGAFNDHYKIDPPAFSLWCSLLARARGSVLWALRHGGEAALRGEAARRGVAPARLLFSAFFPKDQHLAIKELSLPCLPTRSVSSQLTLPPPRSPQALADVFLDTPLYNGHSTASDMLWAQASARPAPPRGPNPSSVAPSADAR
jgi:protein O-GlcNAc transferase